MSLPPIPIAQWSTASFGVHPDTSSMDIDSLQAHLTSCRQPLRPVFMLKKSTQHLYGFFVTRIFSTVLIRFALLALLLHVC